MAPGLGSGYWWYAEVTPVCRLLFWQASGEPGEPVDPCEGRPQDRRGSGSRGVQTTKAHASHPFKQTSRMNSKDPCLRFLGKGRSSGGSFVLWTCEHGTRALHGVGGSYHALANPSAPSAVTAKAWEVPLSPVPAPPALREAAYLPGHKGLRGSGSHGAVAQRCSFPGTNDSAPFLSHCPEFDHIRIQLRALPWLPTALR